MLHHNLTNMMYAYITLISSYWQILQYYLSKYNPTDDSKLDNNFVTIRNYETSNIKVHTNVIATGAHNLQD